MPARHPLGGVSPVGRRARGRRGHRDGVKGGLRGESRAAGGAGGGAVRALQRPPPGRGRLAVTSALATGIPLAAGEIAGQLSMGLTVALGAVTAIYYPRSSWRYRARALPVVAIGAALAATIGATAGGNPWRTAVAVA